MTTIAQQTISGWGRYPVVSSRVAQPRTWDDFALPEEGSLICRGQGRSYGDAAVSDHGLVVMTGNLRAVVSFDAETGVVCAEAGVTIDDLLKTFVPLGWFPSVTPGTKHVSLGGAVAADVHGKNHHRDGSFGHHVTELEVLLADGRRVRCSRARDPALFWATVGGMGLTGVITRIWYRLQPIETSSIVAEHFKAPDLEALLRWLDDDAYDDHYTLAWIDSLSRGRKLGRGILMRGHHATLDELPGKAEEPLTAARRRAPRIPFDFPSFALNHVSVAAFNQLYYTVQGRRQGPFVTDYERFFYPLDVLTDWNRIYGRRGFLQYQIMIPRSQSDAGIAYVLEKLARARRASFLTTLKRFGPANSGMLSFPDAGYTLTLDVPVTGPDLLAQLDTLDEAVERFGGRIYLAKDARLSAERFRGMYPRLGEWLDVKRHVDPAGRFSSAQSRRLGLDVAS